MRLTENFEPWAILPGGVKAAFDARQEAIRLSASKQDEELKEFFGLFYLQRQNLRIEDGIAHIHVLGAMSKEIPVLFKYLEETAYSDILNDINDAVSNGAKAIAFYINSPGGAVVGLPEIGEKIASLSIPTGAWIENMACSAACWLSCSADFAYASKSAMLGSIGTILARIDYSKHLDEMGIKYEVITPEECDLKSTFWSGLALSDSQREHLQEMVETHNAEFRAFVEEARGIELDPKYARGQVLTSKQALSAGIIDEITTYEQFLKDLNLLTKIKN